MDKNLKNLLVFLFIIICVFAIIIGYKKGKKRALIYKSSDDIIMQSQNLQENQNSSEILSPKPILFKVAKESLKPYNYSIKLQNIEEKFSIIDEKGNLFRGSQSEQLSFNLFSLNVLDNDIKKEDTLQKAIKFDIEKSPKEEHYKGMVEADDFKEKEKVSPSLKKEKLKSPKPLIYTNVK